MYNFIWLFVVHAVIIYGVLVNVERPIISNRVDPCVPSPCGPNSQCRVSAANEQPVCSCLQHYVGRAPNCRPECTSNSECAGNLACINLRCQDPCVGTCGIQTTCLVNNHRPICRCLDGYIGDPFSECSPQSKSLTSCEEPIPYVKSMHFSQLLYRPKLLNPVIPVLVVSMLSVKSGTASAPAPACLNIVATHTQSVARSVCLTATVPKIEPALTTSAEIPVQAYAALPPSVTSSITRPAVVVHPVIRAIRHSTAEKYPNVEYS